MSLFMSLAVREALSGVKQDEGGPFGAVIVKDGKVISRAHNEVLKRNDPTAHAEMLAIRNASSELDSFDLSDCVLYTICEPCPMCLAAVHWARIKKVYYGLTKKDASQIGFDDQYFYDLMVGKQEGDLKMFQIDRKSCFEPFEIWENKEDRVDY